MPPREVIESTIFDIVKQGEDVYSIDFSDEAKADIRLFETEEGSSLYKFEFVLGRWGEHSFSVFSRNALPSRFVKNLDGDRITSLEFTHASYPVSFKAYALDPDYARDDGGLELEIILKSKPATNIFEFDIDFTEGVTFIYQPPLTEDSGIQNWLGDRVDQVTETEILDADQMVIATRPENIIYSYAVYAPVRNNKYKTGKIAHIERPKLIDKKGVEEWAELSIDTENKKLIITAPQAFLDSASYPIIVDPTFGYTTAGGSSASNWSTIGGYIDNPGESGTVTKFTAYLGTDAFENKRKCALYTSSGTLQSPQSAENTATRGSAGWEDFTVSGTLNVTAQDYAICIWSEWPTPQIYYDTGHPSGTTKSAFQSYSASWPASVSFSDAVVALSIYATYTSATINVTDVDTDDDVFNGQLAVNVNGTAFEASQGTGKVEFGDAATYGACTILIEQPITSWSDTQIVLTKIRKGSLSNGTVYAYVTNDSDEQSSGHSFTIRENWGMTTVGGTASPVNYCRAMGGSPPNVDNMILRSVSVRVGATHSNQIRLAVYQGGVLSTGPDTATLLKDFGQTTGSATNTWLTLTHVGNDIDVNKTDPLWIAWKGNDSGFDTQYSSSSADAGDFQTARGRYASTAVSSDETVAYASTWPTDGGAFASFWYSLYLTFEIKGWKGGKIHGVGWYYITKVSTKSIVDISKVNGT